ncbi:MAG: hypothetical protein HC941_25270 [Microcoleus sp. SU_5_3]|nr:hypothetical protein [Microcoleus sp. SU_5_3]
MANTLFLPHRRTAHRRTAITAWKLTGFFTRFTVWMPCFPRLTRFLLCVSIEVSTVVEKSLTFKKSTF